MNCNEICELLHPLIDDELSNDDKRMVNGHLDNCVKCQHEYAFINDIRHKISTAPAFPVPDDLTMKIISHISNDSHQSKSRAIGKRASEWIRSVTTHTIAALCGGVFIYALITTSSSQLVQQEQILSAHIRSLMDQNIMQIASGDKHTVAPWFSGKINFAPKVTDLGVQGFILLGARLDYLKNTKVAVIVYKRRKHLINLFISLREREDNKSIDTTLKQSSSKGYNVVSWFDHDFYYAAVSDLSSHELKAFYTLIKDN